MKVLLLQICFVIVPELSRQKNWSKVLIVTNNYFVNFKDSAVINKQV